MYEYPTAKRKEPGYDRVPPRATADTAPDPVITPTKLLAWLRKGVPFIIVFALLGGVAGAGFGLGIKPRFTSSLDILLPPPTGQVVPNELTTPNIQSDAQILDISSKLLLITSGNVLRRTVERQNLQQLPEFNSAADTEEGLFSWLKLTSPAPTDDGTIAATRNLAKRIKVARQGGTYLVSISLWTRDADRSVNVLSALAQSFREELEATQTDLAKNASAALSTRLEELRLAATQAANAVAQFRQGNNLQDLGGTGSVNTQSVSQLNTLLNDASLRLSNIQARYARLNQPATDSIVPADTLDSPTLVSLRSQYSLLKQQYDELTITYGARYPKLVTTRAQLGTLRTEMARETERSLQAIKVDMDQAQNSVTMLRSQLDDAQKRVSTDDTAQVQLGELERNSQAKSALYDTFLKRVGETSEQQQISVSNLRIVTDPVPPEKRSWPPSTLLLTIGGILAGLILGAFAVVATRSLILLRDNNWRFERVS
ncbi:GumC family protein [Agrobacterium sp. rho-13.3]|uniref:GumC family protein n=1 Tax=Agrobacterium sp. rho-13.3 TaxID=3072980 RepID=UPI002A14A917|nr:GumC family protein [Agrobacterium sp. rho-13.3]MDX8308279.1 GumC family protein [Agrobacterium sp. rho-13.3]